MREGKLIYNGSSDRFDLQYRGGGDNGGFHCGDTVDVKIDGQWVGTRFESREDVAGGWYLVGLEDISPAYVAYMGLPVRG